MENKNKRLWIRLSPEEDAFFRKKASNYKTVSAMIRDAVRQFKLAIAGELSQEYYDKVILPKLTHILDFLEKVKDEQRMIARKLIKK